MKKKRVIIGIIILVLLIITYIGLNYIKLSSVYSSQEVLQEKIYNMQFYLGGEIAGIKLLATGVLVMGVEDTTQSILNIGDIILKVNDEEIDTGAKLSQIAKNSNGAKLKLQISRNNSIFDVYITPRFDDTSSEYKLGLWVKDSTAGVGTITFYEKTTSGFAALGHGVTETRENYILPITSGAITSTHIYNIKKGQAQSPGEIKGTISNNILGEIYGNTDKGIYGTYFNLDTEGKQDIKITPKTKIKEGKAYIFVTLEDGIKNKYEIEIEKVILTSNGNKNMIIKITDEELLKKTGGIIQGMSGCPIVQDGNLVGAITHVLLNDATRGYGVFIENMIEDMINIQSNV